MIWRQLVWGGLMSLVMVHASAVEPWLPSATEMASLPAFCKARFNEGSPEYKQWASTLGPDYGHTHHYCAAVNFLNRYHRSRSPQGKRYNLNNARTNFAYMVSHAAPTYSLMPEVNMYLGTVHSLMNQPAQAVTYFNKAIELNPNQPRAYSALADYYVKSKQSAKALEAITEGLRYNPDTKSLKRRYTELGGKLPYPAPIQPTPVEPKSVEAGAGAAATPSPEGPAESNTTSPAPVAEPVTPPPIGSPTNPYCRFCPD